MLGEWAFGCDICQEVCPFNHSPIELGRNADLPQFQATRGAGPLLKFDDIFGIRDEAEFEARFRGSPLSRPGREGLLRNCTAVAGNTVWVEGVDSLLRLVSEESSVIVRESAIRALKKITQAEGTDLLARVSQKLDLFRDTALANAITDFFEQ
jgi:epoxyqueuosine reductase